MAKNIYKNYTISKSLNGDTIIFLARAGKQKEIIGRAKTQDQLVELMDKEAKRFEEEQQVVAAEIQEKEALEQEKAGKKVGLWTPGGLLKDKEDQVTDDPDSLSNPNSPASKKPVSKK